MLLRKPIWILGLVLLGAGAMWKYGALPPLRADSLSRVAEKDAHPAPPAQRVTTARSKRGDMTVRVEALGTVTARETVTVRSRVDGELIALHFTEGANVQAGELIAEIDPRPYRIALDQANGQLKRDEALLENARLDLKRYGELLTQDSIASQQVDAQRAAVHQYEGIVMADRAQVDNASLQLTYSRVTAPISGRVGLRQVDVGNVIHAADAQGLVVITRLQPITVVFSLPSEQLPRLQAGLRDGHPPEVQAYDRAGRTLLATGHLLALDNQIDTATATLKLKAIFDNEDNRLFPNQFVNVRLAVEQRTAAVLVTQAAIQRSQTGAFVYVVKPDSTVTMRTVTTGPAGDGNVVIESGLEADETVVIEGVDKLYEGSRVRAGEPGPATDGQRKPEADERVLSVTGTVRHESQGSGTTQ